MKRLFTSFQYLCICFLCAITQNVFAQGWKIVNESGDDIDMSTVRLTDYNDAYRLTANGDYYIVAPQGKHITSAKLTFLYLYDIAKTKSNSFSSDKKYVLSWKYGNGVYYMQQWSGNINQFIYEHVESGEAIWNIIPATGGGYYIKNNKTNYYIYITGSDSGTKLTSSSTQPSKTWSYTENNGFYTTNGDGQTRYLRYNSGKILLSSSSTNKMVSAYELSPDYPLEKGTYTATVYNTDGTTADNYTLNSTTAEFKELTNLTGLNSDCVKFNISDLAENKFASIRVEVTLADGEVGGNPDVEKSSSVYTSTLTPDAPNGDATPYFGIEVTPIKYNHTTNEITAAINQVCNNDLSHVLYVDMSKMNSFSDAETLLGTLKSSAAPNCLFFMPSSYKGSHDNTIVGGANGTAAGDITVVDQQPFFTPYVFSTGGNNAIYERTGVNGHVTSQNTTLILPFDVPVANKGDLKFYTLSQIGDEDEEAKVNTVAYLFTATEVTGDAVANTPYQVKKEGEGPYTILANNTTFRPTPEGGLVTAQNGSLTAYGNYTGVAVPKGEGILYFSQNYFWNSTTLTSSATIKILPYRVYYKTSSQTNDSKYSVLFLTDDPEDELSEDFGNQDITAIKAMQTEGAKTVWYNMNGQKLNGRPTLPGVYVMNGKKVLIK